MYTKDKDKRINLRISYNDYIKLIQISKDYNISFSDLIRNILKTFLSQQ